MMENSSDCDAYIDEVKYRTAAFSKEAQRLFDILRCNPDTMPPKATVDAYSNLHQEIWTLRKELALNKKHSILSRGDVSILREPIDEIWGTTGLISRQLCKILQEDMPTEADKTITVEGMTIGIKLGQSFGPKEFFKGMDPQQAKQIRLEIERRTGESVFYLDLPILNIWSGTAAAEIAEELSAKANGAIGVLCDVCHYFGGGDIYAQDGSEWMKLNGKFYAFRDNWAIKAGLMKVQKDQYQEDLDKKLNELNEIDDEESINFSGNYIFATRNIYDLDDLPPDMITAKGMKETGQT
jgi:hypothetical protein